METYFRHYCQCDANAARAFSRNILLHVTRVKTFVEIEADAGCAALKSDAAVNEFGLSLQSCLGFAIV